MPGLIAAYKMAAGLALQLVPVVQKPVLIRYALQFDYTLLNDILFLVKRFECVVQQQEVQLFCSMTLGVPAANKVLFLDKVGGMHRVDVKEIS